MGTIKLKKQSAASTPVPATDQMSLFVDSADDILKTKDSLGVVRPSGVGTADELATTGAPVDVSASAPPTAGQFLVATSPASAVWTTISTAAIELATTGAPVVVEGSAPPIVGQVLTATSATNAVWADTASVGLTPTPIQSDGDSYDAAVGDLVRCDVTLDFVEVNLPVVHSAGDQVGIKMISTAANTVDIFPDTGTIDGAVSLSLATDYEWAILMSDGTNWMQIG